MAKEKVPWLVTFYKVRLDGELDIKESHIFYPFGDVVQGRTKAEDFRTEEYNVVFDRGILVLDADDWRVGWLRVYNSGGTFKGHDGKERTLRPNNNLFYITEEDPNLKVKTVVQKEIETVEVNILPASFAKTLEIDQIESWAIAEGLSIPQDKRTKEGIIEYLTSLGRIK